MDYWLVAYTQRMGSPYAFIMPFKDEVLDKYRRPMLKQKFSADTTFVVDETGTITDEGNLKEYARKFVKSQPGSYDEKYINELYQKHLKWQESRIEVALAMIYKNGRPEHDLYLMETGTDESVAEELRVSPYRLV